MGIPLQPSPPPWRPHGHFHHSPLAGFKAAFDVYEQTAATEIKAYCSECTSDSGLFAGQLIGTRALIGVMCFRAPVFRPNLIFQPITTQHHLND